MHCFHYFISTSLQYLYLLYNWLHYITVHCLCYIMLFNKLSLTRQILDIPQVIRCGIVKQHHHHGHKYTKSPANPKSPTNPKSVSNPKSAASPKSQANYKYLANSKYLASPKSLANLKSLANPKCPVKVIELCSVIHKLHVQHIF